MIRQTLAVFTAAAFSFLPLCASAQAPNQAAAPPSGQAMTTGFASWKSCTGRVKFIGRTFQGGVTTFKVWPEIEGTNLQSNIRLNWMWREDLGFYDNYLKIKWNLPKAIPMSWHPSGEVAGMEFSNGSSTWVLSTPDASGRFSVAIHSVGGAEGRGDGVCSSQ